jgi:hypothetical protein
MGFVVNIAALGIHTHNHLSTMAGTVKIVADVLSGLSLTPPNKTKRKINVYEYSTFQGRPQGLSDLRQELSSPAQTLRSWVRIPLETWMCLLSFFCVYVVLCVGSSLATG